MDSYSLWSHDQVRTISSSFNYRESFDPLFVISAWLIFTSLANFRIISRPFWSKCSLFNVIVYTSFHLVNEITFFVRRGNDKK